MKETWFRIALGTDDGPRLVVAPGPHLGAAIELASRRLGKAWPLAAATAAPGEVPLGESVGKGVIALRDRPEKVGAFRWPRGVVAALDGGARPTVVTGTVERAASAGWALEAVAGGDDARERFLSIVERLPAVDNLEVRVAAHFDGGRDDVWLTPRLSDPRRALRFLDDFEVDLLDSGHVDVAAYVRAPQSTWRLTQHKTLVWMTVDDALHARVRGWLDEAGLPRREALPTIADGPHHHYRPAAASPRARLETRLHRARLRKVASTPA